MIRKNPLFISVLSIFILSNQAQAEKKLEHLFNDWHVISNVKNNERICYIVSLPEEQEGNATRNSDPYLLVSKFKNREPEVSISSGFDYKLGSNVEFSIKNKIYNLNKLQNNIAWAKNSDLDNEIIKAMKAGNLLEVKSATQDGKYAIESYSLKGFTKAFDKMIEICQLPLNNQKKLFNKSASDSLDSDQATISTVN